VSVSQVAILSSGRVERAPAAVPGPRQDRRPVLVAFALLALYGVLRWATMLAAAPAGRLLGLVALALLVVGLGASRASRRRESRPLVLVAVVLCGLAMLPMAGFPFAWFVRLRIAVIARAIGRGLDRLPGVIVPYHGQHPATTHVIVLGAGVLLLAAALALCTPARRLGARRLAAAAVPLIVLAIVPSALSRPQAAAVHGVVLFGLLAALLFAERIPERRAYAALAFVGVTALAAVLITPSVQAARPWIDVKTLSASVGSGTTERFDWSQTYGPLRWPHSGTTVLDVGARFPAYWKAEDLELFNGHWISAPVGSGDPSAGVRASALQRWTETLTVTVRAMSTTNVITAGVAEPPLLRDSDGSFGGNSAGTYMSPQPLTDGDRYEVLVYAPHPSARELAAAGRDYPAGVRVADLQLELPPGGGRSGMPESVPPQTFLFAPYGARRRLTSYGGLSASQQADEVSASAYGPVLTLAERLEAGTHTPYQYVNAVRRYLAHGFTYSQSTPLSSQPLLTFLLRSHTGYCQQFAGAMALLLRMGGVPARVSAGFTTGKLDLGTHQYVVSDFDAHSWVEAWFPGYGWVTLDPTPASSDPALAGHASIGADQAGIEPSHEALPHLATTPKARAAAIAGRRHGGRRAAGSGFSPPWAPIAAALALFALGALAVRSRRRHVTPASRLAELEVAFARCGRPLPPDTTLAALEARCADVPGAADYIRAICRARYALQAPAPTDAQRRAMRARLRRGLGPFGWLRALIALPPRPGRLLH